MCYNWNFIKKSIFILLNIYNKKIKQKCTKYSFLNNLKRINLTIEKNRAEIWINFVRFLISLILLDWLDLNKIGWTTHTHILLHGCPQFYLISKVFMKQ